ncbi:MAG: PEP-CTERM sorting domain-containing protein [Caulobacteraceae bacterium]
MTAASPALAFVVCCSGGGGGGGGSTTPTADLTAGSTVNFGVTRQGSASVVIDLPVENTGGGDRLGTGVGAMPANVGGAAPGVLDQYATGNFVFTLSTATAGQFSSAGSLGAAFNDGGSVSFYDASNGGSNLGGAALTFEGTVTQLADPVIQISGLGALTEGSPTDYTLDLGSFTSGSGTVTTTLAALNDILATSYGETLEGSFSSGTSGPFTFAGGAIGDLTGGRASSQALSFDTDGLLAGPYSTLIDLASSSNYSGLSSDALSGIQIEVEANVSSMSVPVPEPPAWALLLSGFSLLGFALRRRPSHAMERLGSRYGSRRVTSSSAPVG